LVEEKQQQQPNSALLLTGRPRCSLVTVLHFSGRSARPRINPPRLARYFRHARSVTAPTKPLSLTPTNPEPATSRSLLPPRAIRYGYDLVHKSYPYEPLTRHVSLVTFATRDRLRVRPNASALALRPLTRHVSHVTFATRGPLRLRPNLLSLRTLDPFCTLLSPRAIRYGHTFLRNVPGSCHIFARSRCGSPSALA
jgi:hypothetical protein